MGIMVMILFKTEWGRYRQRTSDRDGWQRRPIAGASRADAVGVNSSVDVLRNLDVQ